MPKYPKHYTDVAYFVPGRKRKIAGSTKAVNDFLVVVHKEHPTLTIQQLRELIADRKKYIFQPEALEILDAHIRSGFGDYVLHWE